MIRGRRATLPPAGVPALGLTIVPAVVLAIVLAPGLAMVPAASAAGGTGLDRDAALAASQAVIGERIDDFTLLDRSGRARSLAALAEKPLLVSVIYTACVHACSVTTRHLDMAVERARAVLGRDAFAVVTVGFDVPVDRPETMREYARRYSVDEPEWYFLTSDEPKTIEALLDQLGFSYAPSSAGYDHVVQATLLDEELRIHRQVYGETFDLPQLIEPLKDLVWDRPPSEQGFLERLLNRVRLFCTVYDASGDRYVFDYSLFVGIAIGVLVIGLMLYWLLREAARSRAVP
ncbi:MAG: SCO family protein [Wenzhouxiangellaceae bacterium]|nr:SCO family protein [Wenzhouxiangellaceae bacterium]